MQSDRQQTFCTLHCVLPTAGLLLACCSSTFAQLPQAPQYADCRLDSIFPNGGQQRTTVTVTFRGQAYALNPPRSIIIGGPPGITVIELKEAKKKKGTVVGTLEIPAEMPPGTFRIVVAQTWEADIRGGMPGPCTPLVKLVVEPSAK